MKDKIILRQISNPGISFTTNVNKKLISMSDVILKNIDLKLNYSEFQELMIHNDIFSGSYIRSFIPFLYNVGIINDYNKEICFNDFFTDLGKSYIEIIRTIYTAQENGGNELSINELLKIKSDLIALSLSFMCKSSYKFFVKYYDILCFVKEFETINREEFYIMEYCIENSLDKKTFITNSEGKAVVQAQSGIYEISSINIPYGYENTYSSEYVIEDEAENILNIELQKLDQVIVHHYLKNRLGNYTTEKVAEDDIYLGNSGETYKVTPKLDLIEYELEKNLNNKYNIGALCK